MSEFEDLDLDMASVQAWEEYRCHLANELLLLEDDDVIVIDIEPGSDDDDEIRPYVQFAAEGEQVRLEVSSNAYLTGPHQLTSAQEQVLVGLGLELAPEGNWVRTASLLLDGHVDLSVAAVTTLRDVFGMVHPAFVHSDQLDLELGDEDVDDSVVMATIPTSWAHLLQLVDEALEPVFGNMPVHDEDDDIPVIGHGIVTFVRVHRQAPIVELFTTMVEAITNLTAAQFEVNVLNRDSVFIRYVLLDGKVTAHLCLPARPFAADHLRDMLGMFETVTDGAAADLAARTGGKRPYEGEEPQ